MHMGVLGEDTGRYKVDLSHVRIGGIADQAAKRAGLTNRNKRTGGKQDASIHAITDEENKKKKTKDTTKNIG